MNRLALHLMACVDAIESRSRRPLRSLVAPWAVRPALLLAALGLYQVTGDTLAPWPWALSLAIIGMAHGAYDIAVIRRQSRSLPRRLIVIVGYSAILSACAAVFLVAPALSIVSFLALSAHHFGTSDHPATRGRIDLSPTDHLVALSYGVLVLGGSFAFQPSAAWRPFEAIAVSVGGTPGGFPNPQLTGVLASLSMVLAAILLIGLYRRGMRLLADALEQCGVIAGAILLGAFTDPLFAVGSYFLVVHASGHCLRADLPSRPARTPGFANAMRVHLESVSWFLPSLVVVVAMAVWLFNALTIESIALAFITFCIAATAPHHLIWLGVRLPGMAQGRAEQSRRSDQRVKGAH